MSNGNSYPIQVPPSGGAIIIPTRDMDYEGTWDPSTLVFPAAIEGSFYEITGNDTTIGGTDYEVGGFIVARNTNAPSVQADFYYMPPNDDGVIAATPGVSTTFSISTLTYIDSSGNVVVIPPQLNINPPDGATTYYWINPLTTLTESGPGPIPTGMLPIACITTDVGGVITSYVNLWTGLGSYINSSNAQPNVTIIAPGNSTFNLAPFAFTDFSGTVFPFAGASAVNPADNDTTYYELDQSGVLQSIVGGPYNDSNIPLFTVTTDGGGVITDVTLFNPNLFPGYFSGQANPGASCFTSGQMAVATTPPTPVLSQVSVLATGTHELGTYQFCMTIRGLGLDGGETLPGGTASITITNGTAAQIQIDYPSVSAMNVADDFASGYNIYVRKTDGDNIWRRTKELGLRGGSFADPFAVSNAKQNDFEKYPQTDLSRHNYDTYAYFYHIDGETEETVTIILYDPGYDWNDTDPNMPAPTATPAAAASQIGASCGVTCIENNFWSNSNLFDNHARIFYAWRSTLGEISKPSAHVKVAVPAWGQSPITFQTSSYNDITNISTNLPTDAPTKGGTWDKRVLFMAHGSHQVRFYESNTLPGSASLAASWPDLSIGETSVLNVGRWNDDPASLLTKSYPGYGSVKGPGTFRVLRRFKAIEGGMASFDGLPYNYWAIHATNLINEYAAFEGGYEEKFIVNANKLITGLPATDTTSVVPQICYEGSKTHLSGSVKVVSRYHIGTYTVIGRFEYRQAEYYYVFIPA